MAHGRILAKPEEAFLNFQMVPVTMVISKKTRSMEKAIIFGQMVLNTMVIGKMI